MRQTILSIALSLLSLGSARAEGGAVTGALGPTPPRRAAIWLEGVPASAWTVPRPVTIYQKGARFNPDFLIIAAGQTVELPNDDRIAHNVFSISPAKKFDLGHYPQGESRQVRFETPGVVDLFCNIHENMHATVVIAPSTFFAASGAEGHFTIAGVPPGSYRVVAYSPEAGTTSAAAAVTAGGTATVKLTFKAK